MQCKDLKKKIQDVKDELWKSLEWRGRDGGSFSLVRARIAVLGTVVKDNMVITNETVVRGVVENKKGSTWSYLSMCREGVGRCLLFSKPVLVACSLSVEPCSRQDFQLGFAPS